MGEELKSFEESNIEGFEEEEPHAKKSSEPRLAKVEYDYEARERDELSLDKGDVVTVLEQGEGWWKGDLNGKIGVFPSNHVKLIEVPIKVAENDESDSTENKMPKKLFNYGIRPGGLGSLFAGGIPLKKNNKRNQLASESKESMKNEENFGETTVSRKASNRSVSEDASEDGNLISSTMDTKPSTPLPKLPPKKRLTKPNTEPQALVMFDYAADGDDEISLMVGTKVIILDKTDDDGWWKGRNEDGQVGIFPSTYVEEIKTMKVKQTVEEKKEKIKPEIEKSAEEEQDLQSISISPNRTKSLEITVPEQPLVLKTSRSSSEHSQTDTHIQEGYNDEDSPTLPKSPTLSKSTSAPSRRSTTKRTSTYEDLHSPTTQRRSLCESADSTNKQPPRRDADLPLPPQQSSSEESETYTHRPRSLVSPDLPPIHSIRLSKFTLPGTPTDTNESSDLTTSPISPVERPIPIPRPRPLSHHDSKPDLPKSSLAKPPTIPKTGFSPAKPPSVPKRSLSRKDSTNKSEVHPEVLPEPAFVKPQHHVSDIQVESTEVLSEEPEVSDDSDEEPIEKVEEPIEKVEEPFEKDERDAEEKEGDGSYAVDELEEVDDELYVAAARDASIDSNVTDEQVDVTGDQDDEIKENNQEFPVLLTGPKLSNLGQERPAIKGRRPLGKNRKNIGSPSHNEILEQAVASAKDEVELPKPKPQPTITPPPKPTKPNMIKLPIAAGLPAVTLRSVKKPIELPNSNVDSDSSSVSITSTDPPKPIGGVKAISSRFNVPNNSDVEFRLKKWFNEEINKVKTNFETQLAEERRKREALEVEILELMARFE